jgi:hypothetical protein
MLKTSIKVKKNVCRNFRALVSNSEPLWALILHMGPFYDDLKEESDCDMTPTAGLF